MINTPLNPFLKALSWQRKLFMPKSDSWSNRPSSSCAPKAFEKLLHESGVIAGRQCEHVKAEKKCVREFEIRKFRIEDGVGEQAITVLFLAAQNDAYGEL
jgi:hypothetical protein